MLIRPTFVRLHTARITWLATMLALMLQKAPMLRVLFHPQMINGLRSGQMIRAALPAAAAVTAGTVHAQSGATTMTFNPEPPVSGMTGTPLEIAFAFTGSVVSPESYAIIGTLPPGMMVPGATGPAGNLTLNASVGTIEGTPTSAGSFSVDIEAFDGPDRNPNDDGRTGNRSGVFTLDINIEASEAPPEFTTHPTSASLQEGDTATFTVAVSGMPAPTVQWQRSTDGGATWSDLAEGEIRSTGTQTETLELSLVSVDLNDDQFRAVATNAAGTANTNPATLSVAPAPPIAPPNPSRTDTNASGFTAIWDAVFNADGYRIDVATDADFTNFVAGFQDLDVGDVTSHVVSGLGTGTYYFRVRGYNSEGTSASSAGVLIGVGGRVTNLSTRGRTADGADVLIIGFVIQGTQNKRLLIRAAGPRLAQDPFNISGTVPDPRLALFDSGSNPIPPGNDDWDENDAEVVQAIADVFAFGFFSGSSDAAMVVELPPGLYSAHAQTVTGEGGVTIVELYELDQIGELVNISTRAFVGSGNAVLIPGTFLGTAPKRVLVRAVGETLGQDPFNIPGVLEDPLIEVVPAGETDPIFSNDDWGSAGDAALVEAARQEVSAFALPSGSRDASLAVDLPSGGFTFVVRGKNGATGVVLFELYVVP